MSQSLQIFGVLVVFGVLFYLWYAVTTRRGIGSWLHQRKTTREMQIIEYLSIAPRSYVILMEVRGKSILVAQSPHGIHMLHLNPKEGAEESSINKTTLLGQNR